MAISKWEINHDRTRSPLEQTYLKCEIFDEDDCYTVLEKVLRRHDADITQWKARWQIISSADRKTTRMLYAADGTYDTTEAAPTVLNLGYPDEGAEVYPTEVLTHSLEAGGNKLPFTYDYGLRESMLKNYLFTKYSSAMFTDWTKQGSFYVYQKFTGGIFCAWLWGYENSYDYYIHQSINIKNITAKNFRFSVEVCPLAYYNGGPYHLYASINVTMRVMIKLVTGGTSYYLTTSGWGTSEAYLEATIASVTSWGEIVWTEMGAITYEIPGDGVLTVRLQRIHANPAPGSGQTYIGALFQKPIVTFLDDLTEYDSEQVAEAVFDNSVELLALPEETFAAGDAPDHLNNELMYDNCTFLADSIPTQWWKLSTADTVLSLLHTWLKLLASRNRMPRQSLTGPIKGTAIEFNSIIKHAYNSDREFEIAECIWDMYEEKLNATLLEILAFSDEDITVTDEDGTVMEIAGDANLTVASVTLGTNPVAVDQAFNITVHIDNTGDLPGQNTIEWKIVDGSDETQTSGTHASQVIAAADDDDDTFEVTAPDTVGSYTVKCRMSSDTAWVSSGTLTVSETEVAINSIMTIPVGVINASLTLTFNATNSGPAGTKTIYYELYDDDDQLVYSGDEDISFDNGTDDYSLTETVYPSIADIGYYFLVWSEDDPGGAAQSNDFEATAT